MRILRSPSLGTFPVTSGLLALLAALFLVEELRGGSTDTLVLLRMGANFPPLVLDGQWFRLVTAALLHIGFVHLLMNGWALFQLGRLCEITFGSATTLSLFVYTGIAGSALTLLSTKVSAGASGAIFGLEGALVAFFLRHRERLTPAGLQLLKQLLVWSGFLLVYTFAVPGIDWLGHLGGLFAGLAIGWMIRPWNGGPPGRISRGSAALAAALIIVSLASLIAGERFVTRVDEARGIAIEAPAAWRIERESDALVARDPLAQLGTAAFVSAGFDPVADRAEALDRALGVHDLPEGFQLAAEPYETGPWLRRSFVWAGAADRVELAGFAQARCEADGCLVAFATAAGPLYGSYFPTLERIAGSLRREGRPDE